MRFIVDYITERGVVSSQVVEAPSETEAPGLLGLSPSRVVRVRRDWLSGVAQNLQEVHLSQYDQTTLLSTLSASAISGANTDAVFTAFMTSRRVLRKRIPDVMQYDRVSDRLRALNFDSQAVVITETGEKTGDLGESLRRAAHELTRRRRTLRQFSLGLMIPSLTAIVSLISLLVFPTMFAPMIQQMSTSGLVFHSNIGTTILLDISNTVRHGWVYFVVVFVAIAIFWKPIIKQVRRAGPAATISEYFKSIRAISFLTFYMPMFERGVPNKEILSLQRANASARQRWIYDEMLEKENNGVPFSQTLKAEAWPLFMVDGLSSFEIAVPEAKSMMLRSLIDLLNDRVEVLGQRIAAGMFIVGITGGATTILLLSFGLYYPMSTISIAQ